MAEKRTKLKKSMGPGSIWAVAVGSIIGWGCFIQGGLWTQRAGGPLPLFLGFLVGGLLMIVVGYSYSYMIAKFQWQVVNLLMHTKGLGEPHLISVDGCFRWDICQLSH